jgi:hypothetical protein
MTYGQGPGRADASGFAQRNTRFGNYAGGYELHAYFDGQQPPIVARPQGLSLYFDGATDRQLYTSGRVGPANGAAPDETFLAIVEFTSTAGTQAIVGYFSFNSNTPKDYGRGLFLDGGVIKASGVTGTDGKVISSGITPILGRSYVIAARFSANGALFIDGVKVASGNISEAWSYLLGVGAGGSEGTLLYKLSGYVTLAYGAQCAFSDDELAAVTANPWQIFQSPASRLLVPSAAGGGNSFAYTPSGGLTFSGAGATNRGRILVPVGGLNISGAAVQARGQIKPTPAGGVQFAGTAAQARGKSVAPSGGITVSGAAQMLRGVVRSVTGGLVFSGAAPVSFTAAVQSLIVTPVGGLAVRGSAAIVRGVTKVAAGGIAFSGAAGAIFNDIVAVFRNWQRGLVSRRNRRNQGAAKTRQH